jgi:hypothetical protein
VFLRFATGSTMVSYGMIKAIPLQMPAPSLMRLLEPFGNFSPMGVLWASIGASPGYERFAGGAELLAAALLFVPRTATLGALILLADSIQIFTLNMTYDVPVKLFSLHLILMALVLLAPDARRLLNVFVLNRPTLPAAEAPWVRSARAQRLVLAAQLVFALYIFGVFIQSSVQSWTRYGGGAAKPPLYGIWDVRTMSIDGVERAPLVTDYDRWRRVIVQTPAFVAFQRMDASVAIYGSHVDEGKKTITLSRGPNEPAGEITFARPDSDSMTVDGIIGGRRIRMELRRFDHTKMLLVTRGFNWVQEYPFNR